MSDQKPNEGQYIEALDRLYTAQEIINNILLDHVAIAAEPEVKRLVDAAEINLAEAYQAMGRIYFEKSDDAPKS